MKLELNNVVIRPILTEKSNLYREKLNKYVFQVHKHANKKMIKEALEDMYDVVVDKVNIVNTKSKIVRFRYKPGMRSGYKKAYITLKEGSFNFFEGV
jgi:large subunit ribosomal protein L23